MRVNGGECLPGLPIQKPVPKRIIAPFLRILILGRSTDRWTTKPESESDTNSSDKPEKLKKKKKLSFIPRPRLSQKDYCSEKMIDGVTPLNCALRFTYQQCDDRLVMITNGSYCKLNERRPNGCQSSSRIAEQCLFVAESCRKGK